VFCASVSSCGSSALQSHEQSGATTNYALGGNIKAYLRGLASWSSFMGTNPQGTYFFLPRIKRGQVTYEVATYLGILIGAFYG
jgi:hypothetical protein